jgi:hypothetical protein
MNERTDERRKTPGCETHLGSRERAAALGLRTSLKYLAYSRGGHLRDPALP